jgi:hypothetical protein
MKRINPYFATQKEQDLRQIQCTQVTYLKNIILLSNSMNQPANLPPQHKDKWGVDPPISKDCPSTTRARKYILPILDVWHLAQTNMKATTEQGRCWATKKATKEAHKTCCPQKASPQVRHNGR